MRHCFYRVAQIVLGTGTREALCARLSRTALGTHLQIWSKCPFLPHVCMLASSLMRFSLKNVRVGDGGHDRGCRSRAVTSLWRWVRLFGVFLPLVQLRGGEERKGWISTFLLGVLSCAYALRVFNYCTFQL